MAMNIFIEKKINCPACETAFDLKYPNPKLYAPVGRDKDQRVTGYVWTGGIQTDVQPHYYAVLQCPTCLMADFWESFENPDIGGKAKGMIKALADLSFEQRMVLRKLRRVLPEDPEKMDVDSAVAMHLAAIYSNLLPGKEEAIDYMKLGRLYLRLSWLYNEQHEGKSPSEAVDHIGAKKDAVTQPHTINQISNSMENASEKIQEISDLLIDLEELAVKRGEELKLLPGQNPYLPLLSTAKQNVDNSLQQLAELEEIVVQDKNKALTVSEETLSADMSISDTETQLEPIVQSLTGRWPQLPRNEATTLKLAVEALDYSVNHDEGELNTQQSTALANLTLTLLIKIKDLDRALDYSLKIYRTAFQDKQALQMQLNQGKQDKSLKVEEAKAINRTISTLNNALASATESRRLLLEQLYERDKEKITAILAKTNDIQFEQQVQALMANGIREELVQYLVENQILKTEVKKKRWFGK